MSPGLRCAEDPSSVVSRPRESLQGRSSPVRQLKGGPPVSRPSPSWVNPLSPVSSLSCLRFKSNSSYRSRFPPRSPGSTQGSDPRLTPLSSPNSFFEVPSRLGHPWVRPDLTSHEGSWVTFPECHGFRFVFGVTRGGWDCVARGRPLS